MKNVIILLVLGSLFAGCQPERNQQETALADTVATVTLNGLTGLLQSSGLQPQEARNLGVPYGTYQLISQDSYFLLTEEDLSQYWGQCLTVYGQEVAFPLAQTTGDSATEVYAYERKLFKVSRVEPNLYSRCAYSDTLSTRQPGPGQVQTYQGTVKRQRRPAPDIAYDYYLESDQERISSATGQPTNNLNLYATNYQVLAALENAAQTGQVLSVWAAEQAGYAEQLALHVVRTEPVAN